MAAGYISKDTLTNLSAVQFSKFFNVAALAILVHDYCLTFSTEVEYVWGTKWGVTRILFTISRYLGFTTSLFAGYSMIFANDGCGSSVLALNVMYNASILCAEGILILRTWALWGRSKRLLCFLLILAAVFIACAELASLEYKIIFPGDSASHYQFYPSLCAYGSSRNSAFDYGFLAVYEILLQSMNTWRKFRTYRGLQSRTLNTLYWDGIVYMWWIILSSAANMSVMVAAPVVYISALDTAQVAIHSVLTSRIFFNLRECDKELLSFGDQVTMETLRFRGRSTADAATQLTAQTQTSEVLIVSARR